MRQNFISLQSSLQYSKSAKSKFKNETISIPAQNPLSVAGILKILENYQASLKQKFMQMESMKKN